MQWNELNGFSGELASVSMQLSSTADGLSRIRPVAQSTKQLGGQQMPNRKTRRKQIREGPKPIRLGAIPIQLGQQGIGFGRKGIRHQNPEAVHRMLRTWLIAFGAIVLGFAAIRWVSKTVSHAPATTTAPSQAAPMPPLGR